MSLIVKMLNLQAELFLLILVGFFLKKRGIVDVKCRKCLSDMLINVILPANIVNSFLFGVEMSPEVLKNSAIAVGMGAFIQVLAINGSKLLFRRYPKAKKSVMSYGMICSNATFIGLPLAGALFGPAGVMYTSIFEIPMRFAMWTSGIALFGDVDKKDAWRKLAVHPCIVTVFIGFALLAFQVKLPTFATMTITALSRCTTPMSMMIIGAILADADVKGILTSDVVYFTFLRNIAFPLLILGFSRLIGFDGLLMYISVLMTCMPAGSTGSILADKYGGDALYAAKIIFVSTIFSIFTIPMFTALIQ